MIDGAEHSRHLIKSQPYLQDDIIDTLRILLLCSRL